MKQKSMPSKARHPKKLGARGCEYKNRSKRSCSFVSSLDCQTRQGIFKKKT